MFVLLRNGSSSNVTLPVPVLGIAFHHLENLSLVYAALVFKMLF